MLNWVSFSCRFFEENFDKSFIPKLIAIALLCSIPKLPYIIMYFVGLDIDQFIFNAILFATYWIYHSENEFHRDGNNIILIIRNGRELNYCGRMLSHQNELISGCIKIRYFWRIVSVEDGKQLIWHTQKIRDVIVWIIFYVSVF